MTERLHELEKASQRLGLRLLAEDTRRSLQRSWKRPVRHNRKLERIALHYTVQLERSCSRLLRQHPDGPAASLAVPTAPVEALYGVEAAIRMVPPLMPFERSELDRLARPTFLFGDEWGQDVAEREPQLVNRWHEWLWEGRDTEPVEPSHRSAALLGIATSRLCEQLPQLDEPS